MIIIFILFLDNGITLKPRQLTDGQFQYLNETNELLFNNVFELYLLREQKGGWVSTKVIDLNMEGFWIANFAYLPEYRWIGLCALKHRDDGLEREVRFYTLKGKFIGFGWDENLNMEHPREIYYRQFLSTPRHLFVNIWKKRSYIDSDTRELRAIRLEEDPEQQIVKINYESEAFHTSLENPFEVASAYKRKWLFERSGNEGIKLLVLDELLPRIWNFKIDHFDSKYKFNYDGYHFLKDDQWVDPTGKPIGMSNKSYYQSFSRIGSAFEVHGGILVGIRNPNDNFWSAMESRNKTALSPTLLKIIKMGLDGKVLWTGPSFSNGYLVGVRNKGNSRGLQKALIFKVGEIDKHSIEELEIQ